jgi:PAS domain S-box-containing protein
MNNSKNSSHKSLEKQSIQCNQAGNEILKIKEELEMYKLIFNSIHHGCEVIDKKGYYTHFNESYQKFFGLDPLAQIGKHCTDVWEHTRMHIVAETGIAEINQTQKMAGKEILVHRIPIRKHGEVIAVFGQVLFKDVNELKKIARQLTLLESKVAFYEKELLDLRSTRYTFDSIVGVSKEIVLLKDEALKAAANNLSILITGESGTGKELFAQAIHNASPRRLNPFVRINCSAIPKDLIEAELFGYESGAFTGARSGGKLGKFELAHKGTIFLDEIGDLPIEMQPKILRVLEEKEFERVGGTSVYKADFRLIAATNKNLEKMVVEKQFRNDLYYRLNVIPFNIPPLRERRDDLLPLSNHLMKKITEEASIPGKKFHPHTWETIHGYDWPGNVRELSNLLERVLFSVENGTIHHYDLPVYIRHGKNSVVESKRLRLKEIRNKTDQDTICHTLERSGYNKVKAAKLLGIHRSVLYRKMKQYGIPLNR